MLLEAVEQSRASRTRTGDVITYCCREGLVAALAEDDVPEIQVFREASEELGRSKDAVIAGADPATLVEAIERFHRTSERYEGIHVARLSAVIQAFTGTAPPRVKGDLFEALKELVRGLNTGLHAGTDVDEATVLYNHTVNILQRVFLPLPEKLADLRALASMKPTDQDVDGLHGYAFDLRQLNFFFRVVDGSEWLDALWKSELLQPQPSGLWPASAYLTRLIDGGHPRACEWLNEQEPDPNDQVQIRSYLWLSWRCGTKAIPAVLRIARMPNLNQLVLSDLVTFLFRREKEDDAANYVDLIDALLNHVGDDRVRLRETLLRDFFCWVGTTTSASRVLKIIGYKISRAHSKDPRRLDLVAPISELLQEKSYMWPIELLLTIAAETIDGALEREMPEALIDALHSVERVPRSRLVGYIINKGEKIARPQRLKLLAREVDEADAFPETISAVRDLVSLDPEDEDLIEQLGKALGDPPLLVDIAEVDPGNLDPRLRHIHHWLPAMPPTLRERWAEVDAVITQKIGKAPPDARAIGPMIVTWGDNSPFERAELEATSPQDAAEKVRAWRPDRRAIGGSSVGGLAATLRDVVSTKVDEWSARPVEIISALRHPTYIAAYFRALSDHPQELHDPEALVRAIQLVFSEPWSVDELAVDRFDFESDWTTAQQDGVDLLQKLWASDLSLGSETNRAVELVYRAARRREDRTSVEGGDTDAFEAAINRPSMRALGAAFSHAKFLARRGGTVPPGFESLLEESLQVEGDTGLQARAVIAIRLPFVWGRMTDWARRHLQLMFGATAPDGLGTRMFDLYLKWGAPTQDLVIDLHDYYVDAVERGAERAADHLALAYLGKADRWADVSYLLDVLVARTAALSEVGEFLARSAADHAESVTPAISYWKAVLERDVPPEGLGGLGWFSQVESMDDEVWLPLMARTAEQANGAIEWQGATAERAANHPSSPEALSLVTALLTRQTDVWEITHVAEAGMQLLRQSRGQVVEPLRQLLRERLIESEFFEADEIE